MDLSTLPRLAARVRRTVLVRRRWLAGLLAAASVFAVLRVAAPPESATVPVLVAATDLAAGVRPGPDDVVEVRVAPGRLPDGAVSRAEVGDRRLASPLRRGEPLTDVRLVAPSLLEGYPGMVALPLRIPDPGSVDLVRVGDHVDLLATDPASPGTPATPVAADVAVLSIPPESAAAGAVGGTGLGLSGRLVVFAVPESSARHLAAEALRNVLTLVLTR